MAGPVSDNTLFQAQVEEVQVQVDVTQSELDAVYTPFTTTVGAKVTLKEGSDNGNSKIIIAAPNSLSADRTLSLPSSGNLDLETLVSVIVDETTTVGGKLNLLEGTDNGTSKLVIKAADSLSADRIVTGPTSADLDLESVTGLVTRETTTVGGKVLLFEGTDNGVSKTIWKSQDSLAADRTVTGPSSADVSLEDLNTAASAATVSVLAKRDSSGRAKFIAGAATGDVLIYEQLLELHRIPVAASGGNTLNEYGCVSDRAMTLSQIRVYMRTINTQGTYTLQVTNDSVGPGNSCLLGSAVFDMNSLGAATWTTVALTATPANLNFAAGGGFTVSLVSSSGIFDGTGIYVQLFFKLQ
mgnify:CR=1 FL=1